MAFGDTLKRLRKEKGLTLKELSENAGVDMTYASKIEKNQRKNPSVKIFTSLCTALKISPNNFLKAVEEDEKLIKKFSDVFGDDDLFKEIDLNIKKELLKKKAG